MSANNYIELLAEKISQESPLSPDFNYTYMNPTPGIYLISKRSSSNPLRSFPVASIQFPMELQFIDCDTVIKKMCEVYAEAEHKWNKKKQNDE